MFGTMPSPVEWNGAPARCAWQFGADVTTIGVSS
jgi:hypothetical protein